ncbi:MAG: stage III sporulation protein AF, partial [Dysgonamonadaceae bacterium]|nr:stage III sporulation protein AF [Dysgonamonadaceae bacterium]
MLSVISLWVKQIVMVVMFAAFVDFLIPENKFFRYIKVFLGLLVMITIINPLIPLFQKDIALNEMSLVYKDLVDTEDIMHKSEILNMKNNELSIKQYKDHIERYLIQEITEITLYDVKNLTLEIDEDHFSENFGKITKLSIILSEKQTEKKKVKSKEEKIF